MYATVDDYIEQFCEQESAEISNIDDGLLSADRTRITSTIPKAESKVNMKLADRYELPIQNCSYLTWATLAITRMMLHSLNPTEKVIRDFDDVILCLEKIANGDSTLVDDNAFPIPSKNKGDVPANQTYYSGSMYTGNRSARIPGVYMPSYGGFRAREWQG